MCKFLVNLEFRHFRLELRTDLRGFSSWLRRWAPPPPMVLTTEVLPRRLFQFRWSRTASPHSAPPILWPRRKAGTSRLGPRGRQVDTAPLNVLLQEWMEWLVHVSETDTSLVVQHYMDAP